MKQRDSKKAFYGRVGTASLAGKVGCCCGLVCTGDYSCPGNSIYFPLSPLSPSTFIKFLITKSQFYQRSSFSPLSQVEVITQPKHSGTCWPITILMFIFFSLYMWADVVSGHPCKSACRAKPQTSVPAGFSFLVIQRYSGCLNRHLYLFQNARYLGLTVQLCTLRGSCQEL